MAAVVEAAGAKKAGGAKKSQEAADPAGGRFGRVRANLKMGVLGLPNGTYPISLQGITLSSLIV